jgi:hypothetical protein
VGTRKHLSRHLVCPQDLCRAALFTQATSTRRMHVYRTTRAKMVGRYES